MRNLNSSLKAALFAASLALTGSALAADIDMNADVNDVALHGHDPVSYFTAGQPAKGSAQYTATHKNAVYYFASAANRDAFRANPEKFAPQFGGFCALGVALNKKLDIDPSSWKIVDDKLYLNVNKDVQTKWLQDVPGNLKTAAAVWPTIKAKNAADL